MTCKEALNKWNLSAYRCKDERDVFYVVSTSGVWASPDGNIKGIKWFKTNLHSKKSLFRRWHAAGGVASWLIIDKDLLERLYKYGWMFNDPFSHRHKQTVLSRSSDHRRHIEVPALILGAEN